ncbi:hypothetical protein EVAR_41746_1 [Eumeta japonica]|uniref:Uncharacterized protein n=1 Tax=Eumeta variegata TaxID=151549 RepID=A0A4C1VZ75_EUMVA|nr:hypothetical protein EVAR_41746_1 [Eumeta japonica]
MSEVFDFCGPLDILRLTPLDLWEERRPCKACASALIILLVSGRKQFLTTVIRILINWVALFFNFLRLSTHNTGNRDRRDKRTDRQKFRSIANCTSRQGRISSSIDLSSGAVERPRRVPAFKFKICRARAAPP